MIMFYPKVYSYYPALVKITCRANCLSLVLILVFSSFVYAQSEAIIQTTSVRHAQPDAVVEDDGYFEDANVGFAKSLLRYAKVCTTDVNGAPSAYYHILDLQELR